MEEELPRQVELFCVCRLLIAKEEAKQAGEARQRTVRFHGAWVRRTLTSMGHYAFVLDVVCPQVCSRVGTGAAATETEKKREKRGKRV